eukprot:GILK01007880.1.p1 GENE.GILK01007880.1~~GILK01007880.1.p1  ORF type:complete len:471 (-),score=58.53 GILK01007880.1:87-1499(-)
MSSQSTHANTSFDDVKGSDIKVFGHTADDDDEVLECLVRELDNGNHQRAASHRPLKVKVECSYAPAKVEIHENGDLNEYVEMMVECIKEGVQSFKDPNHVLRMIVAKLLADDQLNETRTHNFAESEFDESTILTSTSMLATQKVQDESDARVKVADDEKPKYHSELPFEAQLAKELSIIVKLALKAQVGLDISDDEVSDFIKAQKYLTKVEIPGNTIQCWRPDEAFYALVRVNASVQKEVARQCANEDGVECVQWRDVFGPWTPAERATGAALERAFAAFLWLRYKFQSWNTPPTIGDVIPVMFLVPSCHLKFGQPYDICSTKPVTLRGCAFNVPFDKKAGQDSESYKKLLQGLIVVNEGNKQYADVFMLLSPTEILGFQCKDYDKKKTNNGVGWLIKDNAYKNYLGLHTDNVLRCVHLSVVWPGQEIFYAKRDTGYNAVLSKLADDDDSKPEVSLVRGQCFLPSVFYEF